MSFQLSCTTTLGQRQSLATLTFDAWPGVVARAGTPAPVLQRLAREVGAAMADPALQTQLPSQGMEPVVIGAAAFKAQMGAEIARYRALAHRAGIVAH